MMDVRICSRVERRACLPDGAVKQNRASRQFVASQKSIKASQFSGRITTPTRSDRTSTTSNTQTHSYKPHLQTNLNHQHEVHSHRHRRPRHYLHGRCPADRENRLCFRRTETDSHRLSGLICSPKPAASSRRTSKPSKGSPLRTLLPLARTWSARVSPAEPSATRVTSCSSGTTRTTTTLPAAMGLFCGPSPTLPGRSARSSRTWT